jgi:type VI protein secretion system component VasF
VFVPETAETAAFDASMEDDARRAGATPGLSAHVQQSRNRNLGISRWLVFAIFLGAVVALAMVQFAVR